MTYSSLSMNSPVAARAARSSSSRRGGTRFGSRGLNAVDFRASRTGLGPVSNTVILIVLACLLGLLYLTQVTKTDAYGYQIDKLKTQSQQLQTENENLQLASAQMQSLDRVQNSPQATAMAPVSPAGTVKQ
jgi:hypothetical protein